MTDKKTQFTTIDGEEYETISVAYRDKLYTLRELSVKENRDIDKAATDKDGVFNGQLNLILSLATSIVSPTTSADDIEKWGGKKYLTLSRAYNKLNSLPEETPGKDSAPNSSGAQT